MEVCTGPDNPGKIALRNRRNDYNKFTMKKILPLGRYFFALAITGFGIIMLATGAFPKAFMPILSNGVLRVITVYAAGIILLFSGILIITKKKSGIAAAIIAVLFFLDLVYPQLILIFSDIKNPSQWTITLEVIALLSGAIILAASSRNYFQHQPFLSNSITRLSKMAPYSFAISLIGFGVLHYMYRDFIATLIPAWMPSHIVLDYIVLIGFLIAGICIIVNIKKQLAMFLLGIMFLIFVFTLHLPRTIVKPNIEPEWTSLFIALAMSGISFLIAVNCVKKRTGNNN